MLLKGAIDYHRTGSAAASEWAVSGATRHALRENEARHRRDRLRMTRIHGRLLRQGFEGTRVRGFEGSHDAVRRYARRLADGLRDPGDEGPAFIPLLCIPLLFKPGEEVPPSWTVWRLLLAMQRFLNACRLCRNDNDAIELPSAKRLDIVHSWPAIRRA